MRWGFPDETKMEWHPWFAYWPVKVHNGGWVWLELVGRKKDRLYGTVYSMKWGLD